MDGYWSSGPVTVLLLAALTSSALGQSEPLYFQEGKELVLTPPKHGTAISSVVWTHNTNLVVEWLNEDLEVFGPFKGRTSLNVSNANLIVNPARQSDGGEYRVEINSQRQSHVYTVKVIKKVPKPSVVVRPSVVVMPLVCDHTSKDCTFTCEGDPARTEPVTYSWRWDNDPDHPGVWEKGLQRIDVSREDVKRTGSKYVSCRMTYPVSEEESDRLLIPMCEELGQSEPSYFQEGKELVLTPPKHGTAISSVVWTHNTNLVVEWVNEDLEFFYPFKGRTSLNVSNANLTVNQTRQSDGGEYRVEINSQKQSQVYTVKVIKKVPKPSVVVMPLVCNHTSEDYTFTCEGDPARTEPVTYSWSWGDDPDHPGVWEKGLQRIDVSREDVKRTGSKYVSCRMTYPVSEEESDRLLIPMCEELGQSEPSYFQEGKELVLTPPKHGTAITSVVWTHNRNLVVEWVNEDLEVFGPFIGRTSLDVSNANLIVNQARQSDGGEYRVEINNQRQSQVYTVKVIEKVPKPSVVVRTLVCNHTSKYCNFTCEGDPARTEPVTYSWRWDNDPDHPGVWEKGLQRIDVSREDVKRTGSKYVSCRMTYPVSEEESDRLLIPMCEELGQSEPSYFQEGKELVLTPPKHGTAISSVVWTHNTNLVVEWVNEDLEFFYPFKGRTSLNVSNANLTVNQTRQSDGGEYRVEINSQKQSQVYTVKVIKKVPKPSVVVRALVCNHTSKCCNFTCEGDPARTEPVTYSWRWDNDPDHPGVWEKGLQRIDVSREDVKRTGSKYVSCRMTYPVSEEESDRLLIPMCEELGQSEPSYFQEGKELVLTPPKHGTAITSVVWTHNRNLVVEWVNEDLEVFGPFIGRTSLDVSNANLTVNQTRQSDGGEYRVEINSQKQSQVYTVKVIKKVPKPSVVVMPLVCNHTSEDYTFTCEGDPARTEPVTYSWSWGDDPDHPGVWEKGLQRIDVSREDVKRTGSKYVSCRMTYPVSEEESDRLLIPMCEELGQSEPSYFQEGKELVLTPPKHGTAITSVVWTHNRNLVVEWVNEDLEVFGPFIGRTSLDVSNANLIVNQARQSDGGEYRVEINNQRQSHVYTVKVIKKVPKPSVEVMPLVCNHTSEDYTFTCEGDPARTEPVTYSWSWGDDPDHPGVWEKGPQRIEVSREDVKRTGSKYVSCRMTYPVSEEESDRLLIPMCEELGQSEPSYFQEGKELVLTPPKHGTAISSVVWTHNTNLVVEWVNEDLEFFYPFKGRTSLNVSNANLTVNQTRQSDGGEYRVEINSQKQSQVYTVKVIKKVPKPSVVVRTLVCNHTSKCCNFTCEGDPARTEPVTYSWRWDNDPDHPGVWEKGLQRIDVSREDVKRTGSKYVSCRMTYPVSEEESDRLLIPMCEELGQSEPSYFQEGKELVLTPPKHGTAITSVVWTHNRNLVVEWVNEDLEVFGPFIGRTSLDVSNANLTVNQTRQSDGGEYRVEINSQKQSQVYTVKVIKKVPKPSVVVMPLVCNHTSEDYTFTCEGDPARTEPVTYSWSWGDDPDHPGVWEKGPQRIEVSREDVKRTGSKYVSCRMTYPVSEEESDRLLIPVCEELGQSEPSYFQEGKELVLTPPKHGTAISSVVWTHNTNLVVEWVNEDLEVFGPFIGRTSLDVSNANLIVNQARQSDGGEYRVEINNQRQSHVYTVKVIKKVPKPSVEVMPLVCNHTSEDYTFTCEGDPARTEPVTYSWSWGDDPDHPGVWEKGPQRIEVSREDVKRTGSKYVSCRMTYPVSEEESDRLLIPMCEELGQSEPSYFQEGKELVLTPPKHGTAISSVVWTHNTNLVVEWVNEDLEVFGPFIGRTSLDVSNANLIVNQASQSDGENTGWRSTIQRQSQVYTVKVIKKVPKPSVVVMPLVCDHTSKDCTFTCEGDPARTEPVTYSWRWDNDPDHPGVWEKGPQRIDVSREDVKTGSKNVSCRMTNPVSEEESDRLPNPMCEEPTLSM